MGSEDGDGAVVVVLVDEAGEGNDGGRGGLLSDSEVIVMQVNPVVGSGNGDDSLSTSLL